MILEMKCLHRFDGFVGTSEPIKKIFDIIEKVADTDSTVLISGPTGTGKELIARYIHRNSSQKDQLLVTINCGAIPENLLESELFGHEKGAFTGAYRTRIGRFEMADRGTVFLDEVAEMSSALQVKLLRILQEQKFERVGGVKNIEVDVRVLAATNKNLRAEVNKGTFREDLYYRLNVIPIQVPSLKQRKSDIPLLVDYFLKKHKQGEVVRVKGFSTAAIEAMLNYEWPGNIRELENIVKRMIILCDSPVVGLSDLPEHIMLSSSQSQPVNKYSLGKGEALSDAVKKFEKTLILEALEKCGGVKAKAAKLLRINRTTLVEKIKKQQRIKLKSRIEYE